MQTSSILSMKTPTLQNSKKRVVFAPQSVALPILSIPQASYIVSVELNEDEDVNWNWTTLPNGQNYVSGYIVIKKAT